MVLAIFENQLALALQHLPCPILRQMIFVAGTRGTIFVVSFGERRHRIVGHFFAATLRIDDFYLGLIVRGNSAIDQSPRIVPTEVDGKIAHGRLRNPVVSGGSLIEFYRGTMLG